MGAPDDTIKEFDTGDEPNSDDLDADDLPNSNGTPAGHADCVPAGDGHWPATA
jgi:hypothetical protein